MDKDGRPTFSAIVQKNFIGLAKLSFCAGSGMEATGERTEVRGFREVLEVKGGRGRKRREVVVQRMEDRQRTPRWKQRATSNRVNTD